jgi:hypothetical protein
VHLWNALFVLFLFLIGRAPGCSTPDRRARARRRDPRHGAPGAAAPPRPPVLINASNRIPRMDLSIVIVNWNTEGAAARLPALGRRGLGGLKAEVLVVDNASDDGSVADGPAGVSDVWS